MMNKKIWGQNVNSRRVRESVTSERPHGAEPDRASRNYHRLTIPKMYPNLPMKKKESFCHGLSDYLSRAKNNYETHHPPYGTFLQREATRMTLTKWLLPPAARGPPYKA